MSDVESLFAAYLAEHRAGGDADPLAFLDRAPADERAELTALIDGYLARAPRRRFDPAALRGTSAERTVDELSRSLGGASGLWPALLPALRDRAGLRRSEVVARLAAALHAGDREPRVAGYYHEMEQGRLPAAGVSERVLAALGEILGETTERLREAGAALAPSPTPRGAGAAFARSVSAPWTPDPPGAPGGPAAHPAPSAGGQDGRDAAAPGPEPDDLDALFRDG